jgi:hypothetical protein
LGRSRLRRQWHHSRLASAQANRARMARSACNQPARSVGPAAAAAPLVLGPAILPLECATQAVELLPQRGSRDQGVQRPAPIHRLAEEHSAVRQHPLGCPVVDIRACERPLAVLTRWRLVLAGLDGRRLTQRDDRAAVALLTPGKPPRGHSPCRARQAQGGTLAPSPHQQRHREAGLGRLGRLHPPRQRQARLGAHGPVELVAVEVPGLPGADR